MEITIILPIRTPFHFEGALQEDQKACLKEIASLSGKIFSQDSEFGETPLFIDVQKKSNKTPILKKISKTHDNTFLIIRADSSYCINKIVENITKANDPEMTELQIRLFSENYAIDCLIYEVKLLLLLSNIAKNGALSTQAGYALCGNEFKKEVPPFYTEAIYLAVEESKKNKWPNFF